MTTAPPTDRSSSLPRPALARTHRPSAPARPQLPLHLRITSSCVVSPLVKNEPPCFVTESAARLCALHLPLPLSCRSALLQNQTSRGLSPARNTRDRCPRTPAPSCCRRTPPARAAPRSRAAIRRASRGQLLVHVTRRPSSSLGATNRPWLRFEAIKRAQVALVSPPPKQ